MKKIWRETGRMMVIFLIGAAGTVAGAFVAYALLHPFIPQLEAVAAMMTGSYIGGGVNFAALATEFDAGEIAGSATVADNLLMALYFFALLLFAGMKFFRRHYTHPHIDAVAKSGDLKRGPDPGGCLLEPEGYFPEGYCHECGVLHGGGLCGQAHLRRHQRPDSGYRRGAAHAAYLLWK